MDIFSQKLVVKFLLFVWKRPNVNEKDAGDGLLNNKELRKCQFFWKAIANTILSSYFKIQSYIERCRRIVALLYCRYIGADHLQGLV